MFYRYGNAIVIFRLTILPSHFKLIRYWLPYQWLMKKLKSWQFWFNILDYYGDSSNYRNCWKIKKKSKNSEFFYGASEMILECVKNIKSEKKIISIYFPKIFFSVMTFKMTLWGHGRILM